MTSPVTIAKSRTELRAVAKTAGVLAALVLTGCASTAVRETRALQAAPWLGSTVNESLVVVTVRNQNAVSVPAGSTTRDYDTGQVYGPSPRARGEVRDLAAKYALRLVNAWPIQVLNVHCVVFAAQSTTDMQSLLSQLRTDRRVESAQPLNSFATLAAESPGAYSDPYFNLQSNLQSLQVPQAQRLSQGAGVRVAIIDTGVDAKHPDLAGRVRVQRNFVGGPDGATPERHGTAVAGVIAALANNHQGIVGIAPAAQLLALRACWPAAVNDARAVCNTFTLAQALSAAIELHADVVNLSLGGPADPLLDRLVEEGIKRGIVYVGAALPNTPSAMNFPTNIPGVIGVNTMESSQFERNIDAPLPRAPNLGSLLFAPGANILTLTPSGGYDFMSGSSLAAASVSGGVALILSHRRSTQRDALYSALAGSEQKNGVNFCAAMVALDRRASCAYQ